MIPPIPQIDIPLSPATRLDDPTTNSPRQPRIPRSTRLLLSISNRCITPTTSFHNIPYLPLPFCAGRFPIRRHRSAAAVAAPFRLLHPPSNSSPRRCALRDTRSGIQGLPQPLAFRRIVSSQLIALDPLRTQRTKHTSQQPSAAHSAVLQLPLPRVFRPPTERASPHRVAGVDRETTNNTTDHRAADPAISGGRAFSNRSRTYTNTHSLAHPTVTILPVMPR